MLAKLHQTNIVPVYAAGREGDIEYFAMQTIDGGTLWQVLQNWQSATLHVTIHITSYTIPLM